MYDAVNAIDGGNEPHRGAPSRELIHPAYLGTPAARPWFCKAAATTAAHGVLVGTLPAQQATLDGRVSTIGWIILIVVLLLVFGGFGYSRRR